MGRFTFLKLRLSSDCYLRKGVLKRLSWKDGVLVRVLDCEEDTTIIIGHNAKDNDELEKMVEENRWSELTDECTELLYNLARSENERLEKMIKDKGGFYGRQKEVIEKYIEYAQIE